MDLQEAFVDAQEHVLRLFRAAADGLCRHIEPILRMKPSGMLDFEGSGILCILDDRFYVVTAAHVLDQCEYGVVLTQLANHGPLSGTSVVTGRKPGTTRDDDRFDIGFVRLTREEVALLGEDRFFDLDHVIDGPPAEPIDMLIAIGYPARDQKVDGHEGTIGTAITTFMTGLAQEGAYRAAKIDPRGHVLVRYDRKRIVYNGKTIGAPPDFRGMSGGGVWPVSLTSPYSPATPPQLAAMIVERAKGHAPSLLCTRATALRYFIRRFDDSSL